MPLSQYAKQLPPSRSSNDAFSDEESSCESFEDENKDGKLDPVLAPVVVPQHWKPDVVSGQPIKRKRKRQPRIPKIVPPRKKLKRLPKAKKKKKKPKIPSQRLLPPPPPPPSGVPSASSGSRGKKRPGPSQIQSKRLKLADGSFLQQ